MKSFGKESLLRSLAQVGIRRSDLVIMHSAVWTLGRLEEIPFDRMIDEILNTILDFIGEDGTLVVPAFSYSVCESLVYDPSTTPSQDMGALSEAVRRHPEARRSRHPLQSVAAIGKFAGEICDCCTPGAFNLGGPFDRMLQLGAKLLLLGTNAQAASFVHYVEERCNVPYRYWKNFNVRCFYDGSFVEQEVWMFVRDLRVNPKLDLKIIEERLREKDKLKSTKLGMGSVEACSLEDFLVQSRDLLANDPFCLLSNKEAVLCAYKELIG